MARVARDLRWPLARRPDHADLRRLGLRREPEDDRRRRLPPVRGLRRLRIDARPRPDTGHAAAEGADRRGLRSLRLCARCRSLGDPLEPAAGPCRPRRRRPALGGLHGGRRDRRVAEPERRRERPAPRDSVLEDGLRLLPLLGLGEPQRDAVHEELDPPVPLHEHGSLLGQLLDDNGAPFSGVRASFGFFDGAPIRRNLLPAQIGQIPVVEWAFQPNQMFMAVPPTKTTPLLGWKNYDQVGRPGEAGAGKTSRRPR